MDEGPQGQVAAVRCVVSRWAVRGHAAMAALWLIIAAYQVVDGVVWLAVLQTGLFVAYSVYAAAFAAFVIEVDDEGVRRRTLLGWRRLAWHDVRAVERSGQGDLPRVRLIPDDGRPLPVALPISDDRAAPARDAVLAAARARGIPVEPA